jgi:predicted glycoside hydrolase/deacetylase ChbG (UPF0249 family)
MNLIITADDMGLCRGITNRIVDTYRLGCVRRVSIVPNGEAFDYALSFLRQNPQLPTRIHLNLVEGKPVSPAAEVPLLVDKRGWFRRSFLSLWLIYLFGCRKELLREIETELSGQIERVRRALAIDRLSIDSHRYIHLLPFVAKLIIQRADEWGVKEFRIVRETLFLPKPVFRYFGVLFSKNMVKLCLLNSLSKHLKGILEQHCIHYPECTWGVLHSSRISADVVCQALTTIARDTEQHTSVELVFHPGPALSSDRPVWRYAPRLKRFYFSADRLQEYKTLLSTELKVHLCQLQRDHR